MSEVWVSSDWHFGHANIAGPTVTKWDSGFRNFGSVQEMNETIINNINQKVAKTDTMYFLGDFAFGEKSKIPVYRDAINCADIRLIYGNHDHAIKERFTNLFTWCRDYYEFFRGKLLITMMHYPLGSWNGIGRGAINLHGHCHGNYERTIGRQADVGVDCTNFQPLNIDDIIHDMLDITPALVDHHNSESNLY